MARPREHNPKSATITLRCTPAEKQAVEKRSTLLGYRGVSAFLRTLALREVEDAVPSFGPGSDGENKATQVESEQPQVALETEYGKIYLADSKIVMRSVLKPQSVDLIMTSPPFALVRKKDYGNEDADRYVEWFRPFAEGFRRVLKPSGSLVIDIGGAWKKGQPTRSLYHFDLLITLCKEFKFHLAQEFFWWNPSKLPTPAEWVNVRRVRVKDALNCIWWLSLSPWPRASNRRVLQPYSQSMLDLLNKGYKPKLRPSGHDISTKFQKNNEGAIPPNLIALANTESNGYYHRYCIERGLRRHPARFPVGVPEFFIRMLTDRGDLVVDPFAGSCVTGEASERLRRQWICCEIESEYVQGGKGRFQRVPNAVEGTITKRIRAKPYLIYPPNSLSSGDQRERLPPDGGRKRPEKLGA